MTQEAQVPQDLITKLQGMWRQDIANSSRAASIRNTAISAGGTLSITGGAFIMSDNGGHKLFYVGPLDPPNTDGTAQQGWSVERADGSVVLQLRDAFPSGGVLNQALTWYDRNGNGVFADDTNSGQGIARPYVPGAFYPARNGDWPVVTSTSFDTVYRAHMPKQQPKLTVRAWGVNNTSGATGQIQVMVNGVQLGSTVGTVSGTVQEFTFGPLAVAGNHMDDLVVEIQARLASGTGGVQVGASQVQGQQT